MKSKRRVQFFMFSLAVVSWIFLVVATPAISNQEGSLQTLDTETGQVPKLIIDCDPAGLIATGLDVDDDLALLNAISLHRRGDIELLGISVTGGNAPIDFTFPNAVEWIRRRAGIEIGVHRGGNPMTKDSSDIEKDSTSRILFSEATKFLIETVMGLPPGTVTIVCLGPLTNVAAAYLIEPRIADRVQRIVSMGGTLSPGLPYDLNIRTDPMAAAVVWNQMNCPKIVLPVETCIQAAFGISEIQRVQDYCEENTSQPAIVCSFLFRLKAQQRIMPLLVNWRYTPDRGHTSPSKSIAEGFILWDLVALWAAIRPELYDKWTYIEATVLPPHATESMRGEWPKIALGNHSPINDCTITNRNSCLPATRIYSPKDSYRNQILVPMLLKNESNLHELIFEHLFTPEDVATMNAMSMLTFRERLGSLPKLIVMLFSMALGTKFVFRVGSHCFHQ